MYYTSTQGIIVFTLGITFLLLFLMGFIVRIVYKYQQKQNAYNKGLEELKAKHEYELLNTRLEIQEQTFQHISREIHDNIGQKLTLAKLHLNTLNLNDNNSIAQKTNDTVELIGEAIIDLSDISRSMSSDIVLKHGLIKAFEMEIIYFQKFGYDISMNITGDIIFLDPNRELVLFRIMQEALTNIAKHAEASKITIQLHYDMDTLKLEVADNGKGFIFDQPYESGAGLNNMKKRANIINGNCWITSQLGTGTTIKIEMPIYE